MIKKQTWIKAFALATLVPFLAACTGEDDNPVQGVEGQAVQVSISTRATMEGDGWLWQEGDLLSLTVTGYDGTSSDYTWTYNGDAWNYDSFTTMLPGTVTAWYPGGTGTSPDSFTIPTDQSANANLYNADYMTYSGALNSTTTTLTLEHRLCKVTVTIGSYGGYGSTPTVESEVFHSYPTVTCDNDAWTGTGELTSVTPLKTEDGTDGLHTYRAIVAPATSYEPFMTLKVNGKERTVNCDRALVSGNAYTFTLTVSNDELTLTPTGTFPANGWGNEEDETEIMAN